VGGGEEDGVGEVSGGALLAGGLRIRTARPFDDSAAGARCRDGAGPASLQHAGVPGDAALGGASCGAKGQRWGEWGGESGNVVLAVSWICA
jgi:hypothetical protein